MKANFWGILVILPVLISAGEYKQNDYIDKKSTLNASIYSIRLHTPDNASLNFRRFFKFIFEGLIDKLSQEKGEKNVAFKKDEGKPPLIIGDKIKVPEGGHKNKLEVNFSFLYEIKDDFSELSSIFKIGTNIYFLLENSIKRNNIKYSGIFRINEKKWYELITGTRFGFAADLGNNRVVGYSFEKPLRLYAFKQNFKDNLDIELPDFRYRQELHRLCYDKFIFHNFRINPQDYAVEIYGMDGKRIKECFNYTPYDIKQNHPLPLASKTILASDKKGHFFIAFQYPLNPYRIWKYDENGTKLDVFGNYFTSPDVYESPEDWIRLSLKEVEYYGIRRVYSLHKLLIDSEGRLLVFFSKTKIMRRFRGVGEDNQNYFLDIYSKEGDFLGRKDFEYGFPELADNGIIYSRKKIDRNTWKITAVRLSIK